jgi:hypothetical protein
VILTSSVERIVFRKSSVERIVIPTILVERIVFRTSCAAMYWHANCGALRLHVRYLALQLHAGCAALHFQGTVFLQLCVQSGYMLLHFPRLDRDRRTNEAKRERPEMT